ncbi:ribokinase [Candidatus Leptofilum sp.]|uniref:ribokinase n=1 Tax=Candidatus Leptofilum sp. TaxID=3241576 RepID=UPI003B599D39
MTTESNGQLVIIGSYLVALVMDTERIPAKGETILAKNFRTAYGGKGSDMAVQAARLGADVRFVGSIGDDDFGKAFADLMVEEGVNIDFLKSHEELATGAGFIIKSADGHNIITIDIGANQLFTPEDVDEAAAIINNDSVVLIQLEIPLETALHAAKVGHDAGATVILNPAPAYDLRDVDLTAVDILTPNETELRVCLGMMPGDEADEAELAKQLLARGCRTVLVTLGERGSLIVTADSVTEVPAFSIADIVDSNGAGDSFNASLATGLLEGLTVAEAARFGNAVAGLCCTRWDTVPSYHNRAEVDAFLERNG